MTLELFEAKLSYTHALQARILVCRHPERRYDYLVVHSYVGPQREKGTTIELP